MHYAPGSESMSGGADTATLNRTLPPHLQKALAKVTEISSLPEITTRIVEVVENPKATAHDMHEIVKNDPALAAKILKVVNSAFYGLPSQISSLDRAIVMLGLGAVKNIALAASLSRLFKPDPISAQFSARDLWTHSIAVGVAAKQLAGAGRLGSPDEFFVAGLVHDMGLLIEHQLFPKQLRSVAEQCPTSTRDFCSLEQELVGADHQTFGAALAGKWKFPPNLKNSISYHHEPDGLKPEFRKAATVIYVADTLCCQMQFGFWLTARTQLITEEQLQLINVSRAKFDEITAALPGFVKDAETVFAD